MGAGELAVDRRTSNISELLRYLNGDDRVEPGFVSFYATAAAMTSTSIEPLQRIYRHFNLMKLFMGVMMRMKGNVAECGCFAGLSSMQMCLAYRENVDKDWTGATHHIFDSFEGLSEPGPEDLPHECDEIVAMNMHKGNFAVPLDHVTTAFVSAGFGDVVIHPGWIPTQFAEVADEKFAFVHIDVDLAAPSSASLEFFYPRLLRGGMVITDDYEWPGTRAVFDNFAARNDARLFVTDTNQAFFVK